jgi:hypothetical protein
VQNVSDFPGRQGLSRRCCRHQALRSLLAPELTATRPPYGQENNRRAVQRVGEVGRMLAKTGILTQDGLPDGGGVRGVSVGTELRIGLDFGIDRSPQHRSRCWWRALSVQETEPISKK